MHMNWTKQQSASAGATLNPCTKLYRSINTDHFLFSKRGWKLNYRPDNWIPTQSVSTPVRLGRHSTTSHRRGEGCNDRCSIQVSNRESDVSSNLDQTRSISNGEWAQQVQLESRHCTSKVGQAFFTILEWYCGRGVDVQEGSTSGSVGLFWFGTYWRQINFSGEGWVRFYKCKSCCQSASHSQWLWGWELWGSMRRGMRVCTSINSKVKWILEIKLCCYSVMMSLL